MFNCKLSANTFCINIIILLISTNESSEAENNHLCLHLFALCVADDNETRIQEIDQSIRLCKIYIHEVHEFLLTAKNKFLNIKQFHK